MKSLHLLTLLFCINIAFGYETDQYSTQLVKIKDESVLMDKIVNEGIQSIVNKWSGPKDELRFTKKIYKMFSSRELERWTTFSKDIENSGTLGTSIYRHISVYNSVPVWLKGIAPTINVGGVYFGTDKLSHFFGVGRSYYIKSEIDNADKSPQERQRIAIKDGMRSEELKWGELTTNVFSNADIIANYEGYLFYLSIFRNNVIKNKDAIIVWKGDQPIMNRKFKFSDHVTNLWNEALFPNRYQLSIKSKVMGGLYNLCDKKNVQANIDKFVDPNIEKLLKKYSMITFKRRPEFRLDKVCQKWNKFPEWIKVVKRKAFALNQKRTQKRYANEAIPMNARRRTLDEITEGYLPGCKKAVTEAKEQYENILKFNKEVHLPESIELKKKIQTDGIENVLTEEKILGGDNKFKMHRYNEDRSRLCIKNVVPSDDHMEGVKLGDQEDYFLLETCFQVSNEKGILSESLSYYLKNKFRTRFSIGKYYGLDDRNGYIYRAIPNYCKWY